MDPPETKICIYGLDTDFCLSDQKLACVRNLALNNMTREKNKTGLTFRPVPFYLQLTDLHLIFFHRAPPHQHFFLFIPQAEV